MNVLKSLLLIVAIFVTGFVHAQFHVGVKGGINATKISGTPFEKEFEYNYLVGAFSEIDLGKKISINPEVIFSQTTATRDSTISNATIFNKDQLKAKLNYLSIPVLLNVKLAGPLHLQVGPQYSILVNQDKTFLQNGESAFKSGDFSMIGGVLIKFSRFRLSGRYVIGLGDISDVPNQDKWQRQAIQVAAGFSIL